MATNCSQFLINNCQVVGNSTATGISTQFSLTGTSQVSIQDSAVASCATGFLTGNSTTNSSLTVLVQDCDASNCTVGFSLSAVTQLSNCLAQVPSSIGFVINNFPAELENCSVTNGAGDGFQINTTEVVLQNCRAILNAANGFNAPLVVPRVTNVTFQQCTAIENGVNGFNLNVSNTLVKSCIAFNNNNAGFLFTAGTNNAFTNNISFGNVVSDFTNPPATSLVAASLAAIRAMNATYWWNVTPT